MVGSSNSALSDLVSPIGDQNISHALEAQGASVFIRLGASKYEGKYVLVRDLEADRAFLVALPLEEFHYHAHILAWLAKQLGWRLKKCGGEKVLPVKASIIVEGGGWLVARPPDTLIVSGSSRDYGEAPLDEVRGILRAAFPGLRIE